MVKSSDFTEESIDRSNGPVHREVVLNSQGRVALASFGRNIRRAKASRAISQTEAFF
ncbi:MAG: hypothetical protein LUF30_06630 [Lachnospiraceae bacterium]|nr:hypothetical protein [Lachnospiraceae bacterium]